MGTLGDPDHCWEEKFRNDSRRWLTNHGEENTYNTSMQEHFQVPKKTEDSKIITEGMRRRKMRADLWKQISEEIRKERKVLETKGEYCTIYDSQFQIPGFQLSEITTQQTELHKKYPLYTTPPITVWDQHIQVCDKKATLAGMTSIKDPLNPFKKSSAFTRPVEERLDDLDQY